MSGVLESFGRAVLARRNALGMTQEDLARLVGLRRTSIANIEAGRQNTTLVMAAEIAVALGSELASLIDESAAKAAVRERLEKLAATMGLRIEEKTR